MKKNKNTCHTDQLLVRAMNNRQRNRRTLTAETALRMITESGTSLSKRGIRTYFRSLESRGFGRFVKGTRNRQTRFQWTDRDRFVRDVNTQEARAHNPVDMTYRAANAGKGSERKPPRLQSAGNSHRPVNSPSALVIAVTRWRGMLQTGEITPGRFIAGIDYLMQRMDEMSRTHHLAQNPEYGLIANDIIWSMDSDLLDKEGV